MRLIDEALRALLATLFERHGLKLRMVADGEPIPGSYWGDAEAGLTAGCLHVRADTPLHSALHEAAHFVCMDEARRASLERDAGGDFAEENAVCYLQILWGASLPGVGAQSIMEDMDAWGYTFRLGSAARWFAEDAGDARQWLQERDLIDMDAAARAYEVPGGSGASAQGAA